MVMDTAPATKINAIERLGASIVRATYDECWRTVESHASDRMTGHFVHPFDDDRFIAGNATAGLEILEDLPDVDAIVAPLGGGGLLSGISAVVRQLRPSTKVFAANRRRPLPLRRARGGPVYFDGWQSSFVGSAGGKSVLPTMWPLLSQLNGSIVVTLDEVAR
jgi:threonine dehydratase